MAAATSSRMEIEKMSVEQLRGLKEQADLEVNLFQDSLNNIRTATTRLELACTALHDLSLRPRGKKMLVPLTASLYVPGTLDDAEKVLVDVGTGYFIEGTFVNVYNCRFRRTSNLFVIPHLRSCTAHVEMIFNMNTGSIGYIDPIIDIFQSYHHNDSQQ